MTTVQEAQELLRKGLRREAEAAYRQVLETSPDNVEALNILGTMALNRGDAMQALGLLQRAALAAPNDAVTRHRIARAHEAMGNVDSALAEQEQAVRLDPDFNLARLHLGIALENQGQTERALLHYSRAVKQAQLQGRWLDPASTPEGIRPLVEHAVVSIRNGRATMLYNLIEPLIQKYGRDSLARVDQCLRVHLDMEPPAYPDARQKPTFLYFPGLPTSPYFDRSLFPWIEAMESQTEAVLTELQGVLPGDSGRERVFLDLAVEEQNLRGADKPPSWNGYYFYRHGQRRAENHANCPVTSAALDRLPLSRVPEHGPECLFSVFTAGTHLMIHRGVTNTRVVGHLPLIIPKGDCALNVGGELHRWQKGRIVVFDDTYEHEAWNRSDETRVVLIFDLWNPHLTDVERIATSDIVEAIGGMREAVDNAA